MRRIKSMKVTFFLFLALSVNLNADNSADHAATETAPRPRATATPQTARRTVTIVHAFTRDTRNQSLGEAWRDPSGLIWGDVVKNANGSWRLMDHRDAAAYCRSIGAELPSLEDFRRLRCYLGASCDNNRGYRPQILPNLVPSAAANLGYIGNIPNFWASTIHRDDVESARRGSRTGLAVQYNSRNGFMQYGRRVNESCVRCIVRAF